MLIISGNVLHCVYCNNAVTLIYFAMVCYVYCNGLSKFQLNERKHRTEEKETISRNKFPLKYDIYISEIVTIQFFRHVFVYHHCARPFYHLYIMSIFILFIESVRISEEFREQA